MRFSDPSAFFAAVPVVPVVVLDDPDLAVPLAAALAQNGLPIIEVTLRTEGAWRAIERVARDVPEARVGAGTVLDRDQLRRALDLGAAFAVSPGSTPGLLAAFADAGVPVLPGVSTAGEAMLAREAGFRALKFFPAEPMGGVHTLKALAGPLPDLRFCPTGGIDVQRAATYLGLPNVLAVGGTWVTPPDLVRSRAFDRIGALARAAAALAAARPAATRPG